MKRRDPHQWLKERERDIYFIKAKKEGYRARSAYKLIEIHEKYGIVRGQILDLGAAPGAWLQVALKIGTKSIEGIDLLEIEHINGVKTLKADVFAKETTDFLANKKYDTILCDIAPNMTGQRAHDHLAQINIAYKALELSKQHLKHDGSLCLKMFDGAALNEFLSVIKQDFNKIHRFKPKTSNIDSSEFYLIALDYV